MRQYRSLGVVLVLCARLAHAQSGDDDAAKAHALFDKGMAHFQLEEYGQAIEKWEEGFRIKPVPEFLYNIAQAYRLSKQPDKAISFYKKFLRMKPDAPNRPEVERQLRSLSRVVNEQERAAVAPPIGTIRPGHPAGESETAKEPTPETPAATPSEPAPAAAPTPPSQPAPGVDLTAKPQPEKPLTKKPWFWAVVGGSVAAVALGVGLGVGLTRSPSDPAVTYGRAVGN
jgi:iron complex outermembrane receptor protein